MPELSYAERERLLRSLLGDYVFIQDVYGDAVVFEPYYQDVTIEGEACEQGQLYRWKYAIDDKGVMTLSGKPETVQRQVKYQKVKYSGAFAVVETDQEWVYREGKVWELAFYSDKIPVSEDQLERAITNFAPVKINLEHESTPLDGKLGMWEKVWRVGNDVWGRLRIPKWLDSLFKGEQIKCSVEFTADRRFCGIALCNYPRVADAAIFGAFSAYEQGLRSEITEPLQTKDRMNWLQKLSHWHKTGQWPADANAQLEAAGYNPETAAAHFSETPIAAAPAAAAEESPELRAFREQAEAQNQQFRSQIEAAESRSLAMAAKEFCRSYIDKKKMLPAEVEGWEGLYINAVRQDAVSAKSGCFSADGSPVAGAAVKAITDLLDARPEFFMAGAAVLGDGQQDGQMSQERKLQLLKQSRHYTEPKAA